MNRYLPLLFLAACSSDPTTNLRSGTIDASFDLSVDAAQENDAAPYVEVGVEAGAEPGAESGVEAGVDADASADATTGPDAGDVTPDAADATAEDVYIEAPSCDLGMVLVSPALCYQTDNANSADLSALLAAQPAPPAGCTDLEVVQGIDENGWATASWCAAELWCSHLGAHVCSYAEWLTGCKSITNTVPLDQMSDEWLAPKSSMLAGKFDSVAWACFTSQYSDPIATLRIRCCKEPS